jgi:hypothetical protein
MLEMQKELVDKSQNVKIVTPNRLAHSILGHMWVVK